MNSQDFIGALHRAVYQGVGAGILRLAEHPVGRGNRAEKQARAAWMAGLDAESRAMVAKLVDEGVHAGIFGVLCVLDGVRAIEDPEDRGDLSLTYTDADGQTVLNSDDGEMLHDIFNGLPRDIA